MSIQKGDQIKDNRPDYTTAYCWKSFVFWLIPSSLTLYITLPPTVLIAIRAKQTQCPCNAMLVCVTEAQRSGCLCVSDWSVPLKWITHESLPPVRKRRLCVISAPQQTENFRSHKNCKVAFSWHLLFFGLLCAYFLAPLSTWQLQPSGQWTRTPAILHACQLSPLGPTDSGGMGNPLEANGSCPPPRPENELECCLPQTHQAATMEE